MKEAKLYENSNLFVLQGEGLNRTCIHQRGEIKDFSRKSRTRILQSVSKIDTTKIYGKPHFITLTYPSVYSLDFALWKRDLATFVKAFNRRFSNVVLIWRLEYQQRGAPHFHLIAFNTLRNNVLPGIARLRSFVAMTWFKSVASGLPEHLEAGTNVEIIKSWRGVTHYASKYMAKRDQAQHPDGTDLKSGRYWGIYNRKYLPVTEIVVSLSHQEFHYLRRAARAFLKRKVNNKCFFNSADSGLFLFLDYETAFKFLEGAKDHAARRTNHLIDRRRDLDHFYHVGCTRPEGAPDLTGL